MFKTLLSLLILGSSLTYAENVYRFEVYGSTTNFEWNALSPFNQDNKILKVPTFAHTLEVRPDLQFNFSDSHSLIVRSRHFLQSFETQYTNPDKKKYSTDQDSDLSDLFFSSVWNGTFATTIGLQNYQWGPAEIFSPSNPFFHFNNSQRSYFYKEKGRVLVRANWNPSPQTTNWSVVGLYEPIDNNTRYWIADRDFKPQSALKIEYQFDNPTNSIAIIGGQGENQRGFVGEYFTWSPYEGKSFYMDAQHRSGRSNYVPEKNGLGLYDLVKSQDDKNFTLAVLGFRWEGRVDLRQEFVFNEEGYNNTEWKRVRASGVTLSPNILQNSRRFAAIGTEFHTKSYSYTSVRIPDLGLSRMASIAARWFSSLDHDSAALQMNFEYNWNDNTVLSVEAVQYVGDPYGEFRIVNDKQASFGFRWSY